MHDLRWFEEYAESQDILTPLTDEEWKELARLLHEVNNADRAHQNCGES
jgi:hypothetical protein